MEDIVFVRKVAVQAEIGLDCWQRPKPQPALLSLKVYNSVERAGQTDHIDDTLDYRGIYKFLSAFHGCKVNRAGDVLEQMWIWGSEKGKRVDSVVELPKALLHSEGVRMETTPLAGASDSQITFHIQNLIVPCIIGIGAHERIHKQPVVVNIELEWNDRTELINSEIKEKDEMLRNIPGHFGGIYERFEASSFQTLEAFTSALAKYCIVELTFSEVKVNAYKPSVFAAAEGPGVEIYRTRKSFPATVNYPAKPANSLEGIH